MIAITGASGFLGRHLVRELISQTISHRCLVRSTSLRAAKIDFSHLAIVNYDDQASVDASLSGCETLIHFLGLINGTEAMLERVNVEYSRRIIEAAQKAGVKRIVWVSSVAAVRRHGFYGVTKFEGEKLVQLSGIPHTILRPAYIYGNGDENNTAMMIRTLKRFPLIPLLGGGNFKLQPVYVDDVIQLIMTLLKKTPCNRAYAVAGPRQVSLKAMLQLFAVQLNKRRLFVPLPLKPVQALVRIYFRLFPRTKLPAKQILELDKHEAFDISETTQEFGFHPRTFSEGAAAMFVKEPVCAE